MQDFMTEAYALTRVRDVAQGRADTRVADVWVAAGEVNRLHRQASRRPPVREWLATHFGWETAAEAIRYRPAPIGRAHTGHSAFSA